MSVYLVYADFHATASREFRCKSAPLTALFSIPSYDLTARILFANCQQRKQHMSAYCNHPKPTYCNMIRDKVVPEKKGEEPRLDSGAALSDPVALSDPAAFIGGSEPDE